MLREQEQRAAHPEGDEDRARDRAREPAVLEEVQVEHRVLDAVLPVREEGEDRGRDGRRGQDAAGGPAVLGPGDDRVHERGHADRRQQRARQVGAVAPGVLRLGDEGGHGGQAERHDRQVDQEDRAPPEVVEHEAAEQRPRREAERVHRAPDADGPGVLVGREDLQGDREGGGEQQRPADAHAGPRRDQLPRGTGESGDQRADAEQGEPRDQHLLAAVAVGGAARGEQQAGLHERVGVDHPLDVGGGRAQLLGEGGDRHVQDGVVEQHGELRQADHSQDQPPPGMAPVGPGRLEGRHTGPFSGSRRLRRGAAGVLRKSLRD